VNLLDFHYTFSINKSKGENNYQKTPDFHQFYANLCQKSLKNALFLSIFNTALGWLVGLDSWLLVRLRLVKVSTVG
jgi:hypothetical protein